jgi:hypothetical protein
MSAQVIFFPKTPLARELTAERDMPAELDGLAWAASDACEIWEANKCASTAIVAYHAIAQLNQAAVDLGVRSPAVMLRDLREAGSEIDRWIGNAWRAELHRHEPKGAA